MVQHCPRPLRNSIFKLTQNKPNDPKGPEKIYNLHYNDVQGDVLRPPHGTTPPAEKKSTWF